MAAMGRKPKPDAVKNLHGSDQPRNPAAPVYAVTPMRAPSWLLPDAKKEWRRIVPIMTAQRVMTDADKTVVEAYCQLYARWVQAEKLMASKGPGSMLIQTTNGNVIQSPLVGVANRAMELMLRAAAELGLTPSSRTRVQAQGAPSMSMADLLFTEAAKLADAVDAETV